MPRKSLLPGTPGETPKIAAQPSALGGDPKRNNRFPSLKFVYLLLLVGSVSAAGFFYWKYRTIVDNPQAVAQEEVQKVTALLGKLMLLPEETPTIATVSDKEKLPEQPFFLNAQNGDRVLVYSQAKKAILYRESENRIIEVMPLAPNESPEMTMENTSSNAGAPSENMTPEPPTEVQSKTIRIALYNGTNVQGKTYDMEQVLTGSLEDIEIVQKKLAKTTDYTQTKVINLTNIDSGILETIAKTADGKIGELEDEDAPDADVLIIIGG